MSTTRHVWGKYTKEVEIGYRTRYRDNAERTSKGNYYVSLGKGVTSFQMGSGYTFSTTSGRYTRTGLRTYSWSISDNGYGAGYLALTGNKLVYSSWWGPAFSGSVNQLRNAYSRGYTIHTAESYREQYSYYVQGSFIQYVSSSNSGAYPSDDYTGSYWYVKQGTDNIDPESISIPESIIKDENISITLTPSQKKTQPGNVSYMYQYKFGTNGAWTDLGTSSSTTMNLVVPQGTENVQIRALAKDDLGFTSSTWVYSNTVSVINNFPPEPPGSIESKNVIVDQMATITITEAIDPDGYITNYYWERSIDGSAFTQIAETDSMTLSIEDGISVDWGTVTYRVRAKDDYGAYSEYITSLTYTINEGYLMISAPQYNLGEQTNPFMFIFSVNTTGETLHPTAHVIALLDGEIVYENEENALGVDNLIPIDSRLLSAKTHTITIQASKEGYITADALNIFNIPGITAPGGGVIEQLQNSQGEAVLPYTLGQCVIGKDGKDMNTLLEEYQDSQIKVYSGMYAGTGSFGESNPNVIAVEFTPKFAFIAQVGNATGIIWGGSPTVGDVTIQAVSGSLSWFANSAEAQYNTSGTNYYYMILG